MCRRQCRTTRTHVSASKAPAAGSLTDGRETGRGGRRAGLPSERNRQLKFETAPTDIVSVMNDAIPATTKVNLDGASPSDSEILTVLDVARFLRVPKSTVYKLARLGQLPASKIGKHWRFLRRDIHDWMHNRTQQS